AEAQRGATPVALLDRALARSGYEAWLEQHPEGRHRLRTLARLRGLAQRPELPVAEWLVALALGDELTPVTEEVTHLSSVHQAKGKEFRTTFVLGVEEGLMPHYRATSGRDAGEDALE